MADQSHAPAQGSTRYPERAKITGVVLAGGRGSRMGGADKGLLRFRGRAMVDYALAALEQSTGRVLINCNRNYSQYAAFGYPVITDASDSFAGPLAGLLSAIQASATEYLLTLPCDCPMLDAMLLERLKLTLSAEDSDICVASDGARLQPMFMLLRRDLQRSLEQYLASGERKVETWIRGQRWTSVDYADCPAMFVNINTPDDLRFYESVGCQ